MSKAKILSITLAFLPSFVIAKDQSLAEAVVIGGAQGLIIGVAAVIYFYVWKPFKKKQEHAKQRRIIANDELSPLIVAAAEGNDLEVERLLAEGVDINTRGKSGQTALMLAAMNDRRATVRLLLRSGADVYARTAKGNTARDIARQHKKLEVADILSEKMEG